MPAKRKRGEGSGDGCKHMSIRVALRKLQEKARVETKELKGNFDLEGSRLHIGEDTFELVTVPPDGNCAFATMAYILHVVVNGQEWTTSERAYECTGVGSADELREAFDVYRNEFPREGVWGDQFDWVVFCAMFGVTVHIVSYNVSAAGYRDEMHSVIGKDVLGQKAFIPAFVKVDKSSVDAGLHAYVCNHYNTHYDPMRLVRRD